MRLPTIIKLPQHKTFNFQPRYWDKDKEELQERIERVQREMGKSSAINEDGKYVPLIKGHMRSYMSSGFQSSRRRETQKANSRFVIILAILGFIAYYLFYY